MYDTSSRYNDSIDFWEFDLEVALPGLRRERIKTTDYINFN